MATYQGLALFMHTLPVDVHNLYKQFWIHASKQTQRLSTAVHSKCALLMHRLPVDVHNIYKLF